MDNPQPVDPSSPTAQDILRYRYHHGCNLGSIFVLEKWLYPGMFVDGASGTSELDAVTASLQHTGLEATKSRFLNHWTNALTPSDWNFLTTTAHCTTIRLPLGFFTLLPHLPPSSTSTPFSTPNSLSVYAPAWALVRSLVAEAYAHGVGILLDLHALPGGANPNDHSGTSSGKTELWQNSPNLALASSCIEFLATEAKTMPGVIGIQVCNEAATGAGQSGMYDWYGSLVSALSGIDAGMPVYISDAWDLSTALGYSNQMNVLSVPDGRRCPVVVDTHKYYCFSDADKAQSPAQILARVPTELGELDSRSGSVFDGRCAAVMVGEYSCVLDGQSWSRVADGERAGLTRRFGQAQSQTWQRKAGGSAFWTAKMEWMPGGDWGFVAQTEGGAVTAPASLGLGREEVDGRLAVAAERGEESSKRAVAAHADYWEMTAPGLFPKAEEVGGADKAHPRYVAGYTLGYKDAGAFFAARGKSATLGGDGGHRIGLLDLWVLKRMREEAMSSEKDGKAWEWEQGFRKGVIDYEAAVEIGGT